jgi:DNA-binding CsgD family transcriptional regulator
VFIGIALLTLSERRFGEVGLKPRFLLLSTSAVCIGAFLMILGSAVSEAILRTLGYVGAFTTGLCSAPFFIAWSKVYGSLEAEDAEIAIPLAVALGQLISILFYGLQGLLAILCLILAPLLSYLCLLASFSRLRGAEHDGVLPKRAVSSGKKGKGDGRSTFTQNPFAERNVRKPALLGWRCGLFSATVWFILSSITSMTNSSESGSFALTYLTSFIISFIVLLVLMILYVVFSRNLSLIGAVRILLPMMVISLVMLLFLPSNSLKVAFLLARTGTMFFWAILWISCAQIIREKRASATKTAGVVRGWIQGGAALSIPVVILLAPFGLNSMVLIGLILLVVLFAAALPGILEASRLEVVATMPYYEEPAESVTELTSRCDSLADEFNLSPREREIMECLIRGRNLPYIRETLYISRNTINTHVRHIYAKMDIHSKQELINLFDATGERGVH